MSFIRAAGLAPILGIAVGAASLATPVGGRAATASAPVVDGSGAMHIPDDYRKTYEALGSWAVAAEGKGSKQIHAVYASPEAVAAYRRDGKFPDGTVLIKEVYNASTGTMTTGTVSREDGLVGWFMMVKDAKDSHPDNKLWGNGWGWSWFDASNPLKTTSTSFRADCLGCHIPAKATDWIYVQGYPPLRK